jgi:hypothetical protein
MNWTIDDTALPAFLRLKVEGTPTSGDYVSAWQTIIRHRQWQPGTPVLIDATKRDPLGSQAPMIVEALAEFFGKHNTDVGPTCVASITKEEQGYIYKRLLEYSANLRGADITMRNFDDENAAIEWLTRFCNQRKEPQKTNH